jgi:hypothetical protein
MRPRNMEVSKKGYDMFRDHIMALSAVGRERVELGQELLCPWAKDGSYSITLKEGSEEQICLGINKVNVYTALILARGYQTPRLIQVVLVIASNSRSLTTVAISFA